MATVGDGYDYTFESCSFAKWGTVALEVCHKGFGRCCLLSAPQDPEEKISTRPFQLVTGRHWQSFLQGNVKTQEQGESLIKTVEKMKESLGKHIFREENIIPVEEFPAKWADATQIPFQRAIIKF